MFWSAPWRVFLLNLNLDTEQCGRVSVLLRKAVFKVKRDDNSKVQAQVTLKKKSTRSGPGLAPAMYSESSPQPTSDQLQTPQVYYNQLTYNSQFPQLGPLSTTRIFAVRRSGRFAGLVVIHCFLWEFVHEPSRKIYRSGCRMQYRIPTVETAAGRCTVFSVGHALTCLRVHEPACSPSVISWPWACKFHVFVSVVFFSLQWAQNSIMTVNY
jgi:hypothetical protein